MAIKSVLAQTAAPLVPPGGDIADLRDAAADCRACDLWRNGTQTVFGAGPDAARVVFVREQPGNDEDLAGQPFVGPAGRVLDGALEDAGIDRAAVYLTNAVKHFKWEARGKKRIHSKPNGREIRACKPWLEAELHALRPRVVVVLGATAAQALLGATFRVTQHRAEFVTAPGGLRVFVTVHPSSILRAPDDETRALERARFSDDLRVLAAWLREPAQE